MSAGTSPLIFPAPTSSSSGSLLDCLDRNKLGFLDLIEVEGRTRLPQSRTECKASERLRQGNQDSLVNLGESVVKGIHVPIPKFGMVRLFPLVNDIRYLGLWDCTCLVSTNHKIIDLSVGQVEIACKTRCVGLAHPKR